MIVNLWISSVSIVDNKSKTPSKMSTKGAQFLHLACQGECGSPPCPPVSYATAYHILFCSILKFTTRFLNSSFWSASPGTTRCQFTGYQQFDTKTSPIDFRCYKCHWTLVWKKEELFLFWFRAWRLFTVIEIDAFEKLNSEHIVYVFTVVLQRLRWWAMLGPISISASFKNRNKFYHLRSLCRCDKVIAP